MRLSVLFLVLIAILIQSASGCGEKTRNNEAKIRLYKPQRRLDKGEARFTSAILNKLALKGKLTTTTTTTPAPTTTITTSDPTTTSGTVPSGTTTSATNTEPNTSTSGTGPQTETSGTGPQTETTGTGPQTETSGTGPQPDATTSGSALPADGNDAISSGEVVTSRAAYDDDSLNDEDEEVEKTENNFEINYNDKDENNISLYDNLNQDSTKINSNVHLRRSPRPRSSNWRRNQLKGGRIQQIGREQQQERSPATLNRSLSQRRNRGQRRRPLNRRQTANMSGRRRRTQRRRNNGKRKAQRRVIFRRRRQIRNNRNRINNKNSLRGYRRRPTQKIIIRE